MKNKQLKLLSSKVISVALAASVLITNVSAMKPAQQSEPKSTDPGSDTDYFTQTAVMKLLNKPGAMSESDNLIVDLLIQIYLAKSSYDMHNASKLFEEALGDSKKACIALLGVSFSICVKNDKDFDFSKLFSMWQPAFEAAKKLDEKFFYRLTDFYNDSTSDFMSVFVENADNLKKLREKVQSARSDKLFTSVEENRILLRSIEDLEKHPE